MSEKPPRLGGLAHLFAAATYSGAGFARLMRESAFRQELLVFVAALAYLAFLGVSLVEYAILVGLFLLLVAVEALNTAIECIVDHISPEWAEFAKHAKDLGSLAVMCVLLGAALFLGVVTVQALSAPGV